MEEKCVTHDQDLKEKRKRPGWVVLYFAFQKIKNASKNLKTSHLDSATSI